jgi:FkbM family methyltransferase
MYFDIGANIGNWSLANVNQCDKIISIEASPITFTSLVNNCKNDKIILVNYAVCNNNGNDVTFYDADSNTLSTLNKDWLSHAIPDVVCRSYQNQSNMIHMDWIQF